MMIHLQRRFLMSFLYPASSAGSNVQYIDTSPLGNARVMKIVSMSSRTVGMSRFTNSTIFVRVKQCTTDQHLSEENSIDAPPPERGKMRQEVRNRGRASIFAELLIDISVKNF